MVKQKDGATGGITGPSICDMSLGHGDGRLLLSIATCSPIAACSPTHASQGSDCLDAPEHDLPSPPGPPESYSVSAASAGFKHRNVKRPNATQLFGSTGLWQPLILETLASPTAGLTGSSRMQPR